MLYKSMIPLVLLFSLAMSPLTLASDDTPAVPDCKVDPEACQAMLAKYEDLYGPLPTLTPSSTPALPLGEIHVTEGKTPPADVRATIDGYMKDLQTFAKFVCTHEDTQYNIWVRTQDYGDPVEEVFASIEATDQATIDEMGFDLKAWGDVSAALNTYLQQQTAAGYSVPSRAPTLLELAEQYPGCSTGEHVDDWE